MTDTAVAAALRKSAVSRYLQLAEMFRQRIAHGEWPIGRQIPTIAELAEQCGVASMTVRHSLDLLEKDGLIERFRGKGTFVRDTPARDIWCAVRTDWSGLLIARYSSRIEVLSNEPCPVPTFLDGGDWPGLPASKYRRVRRRYWRDGEAFLIADIYIDATAYDVIPQDGMTTLTALRLISDLPGRPIDDAQQELTVQGADPTISDLLSVPLGAPIARVVRVAVDDGGTRVMVVDGVYRGDNVRLRVGLK